MREVIHTVGSSVADKVPNIKAASYKHLAVGCKPEVGGK
jgi:hypothetical protein